MSQETSGDLREAVRARYAEAARAVLDPKDGAAASCCDGSVMDSCCGTGSAALDSADCFGGPLYGVGEVDALPEEAVLASLGCGNPLAVADLHEGERVLDLGSSEVVATAGLVFVIVCLVRTGGLSVIWSGDWTESACRPSWPNGMAWKTLAPWQQCWQQSGPSSSDLRSSL